MARRRKVRFSGRFYLTMLVLLGIVVALVLIIPSGGGGTLRNATMEAKLMPETVIIRNESTVAVDKFDMVDHLVDEGASVNAEVPVATVYKWGYSSELAQSLVTIQKKIYEKQLSILDGIESTELTSVNGQIAELKSKIASNVSEGGDDDLLELERSMKELLNQRTVYLKNSVQADVELNSLYSEETAKLAQIAEYTSTVNAKMTGLVSFYFDGYELVLNGEKLDVVSADVIKKIINGESGVNAATSESLLFRLVDPNKWYAAFITSPSEGASLMGGQTYTVTFDGMKDIMYTATALEPVVCDGGIVNMLEFTENIGELLSIRVIKATVTAQLAGLEMNAAAVKSKNGESYIATSTGDVPVTVIAINGDKALITGDGLVEGMRYKKLKYVIGNASLIQSVDRLELAKEISRLAVKAGITQDVLAEVNIGGEAQKGGIAPDELNDLISIISELPGIRVKGLMCVPPAVGEEEARRYFASMRRLFEDIASAGIPGVDMRELSMGMSGDYKSAIKEGATMVRVGTAIFGARPAAVARA